MNPLVILVVTVLLAATLKDDSAAVANSDYWYTLTVHPVIAAMKTYSPLLLLPTIVCFFYIIATSRRITAKPALALLLLSLAVLVSALRATAELGVTGIAMGAPLMLILLVLVPLSINFSINGSESVFADIRNSLLIFSTLMILANFFTYITGYGFASGVPRLFGTSSHPNFLGVLMALCLIVILDYCTQKWSAAHLILAAVFVMGLIVLYKSGSRTGIIMLFAGGSLLYWSKTDFSAKTAAAILGLGLLVAAALVLLASGDASDSPFDRGDGSAASNTRAEAWSMMFDLLKDEPLVGYGYPVGPSENSIMRGWVAYGILYALFLAGSIIGLITSSLRKYSAYSAGPLFIGLSVALALGAMLEGYLVDRFSGPIMIYIVVCCAAGFAPNPVARPSARQRAIRRRASVTMPNRREV